jgi:hypothetical protein
VRYHPQSIDNRTQEEADIDGDNAQKIVSRDTLKVQVQVVKKIARIFSDSGFGVAGARHARYGKIEPQLVKVSNMPKSSVNRILNNTIFTLLQVVQTERDAQQSQYFGDNAGLITETLLS